MKAYAYIRVSTVGQVDKAGMDRQLMTIAQYAAQKSIELVKVYREEGVSGTVEASERPAFKAMLAEILSNGVKTIIVERLDRLARSIGVQQNILAFLVLKGVTLISADTRENITEAVAADPMRKAMVQMQGVFAELEKDMLVAKLQKARQKVIAEKGKCGGPDHYGEKDEHEKMIINEILIQRAEHWPLRHIAETLNAKGYTTKRGADWTGTQVWRVLERAGVN